MKIAISKYSVNAKRLKSFKIAYENSVAKIIVINLPFDRFLLITLIN